MFELEKEIGKLEEELFSNNTPELQQKVSIKRAQYNELSSNKALSDLTRLRQSFYEQGEKAGKLLAWRIKVLQSERAISEITNSSGALTTDPTEINDTFKSYYEKLYTSEPPSDPMLQTTFLDGLEFPRLSDDERNVLDRPIQLAELFEAVGEMSGGKAPGPDGIPIDIYKTFKKKLLPPFLDMVKEAFEKGLPPTLQSALITVILKPGKSPSRCESYRPISSLNSDTKLLAKTLALRLDSYLPSLVGFDQNGFVKGRQGFHNIRRAINIVHEMEGTSDAAILSLDAEKAFDRVQWPYLFDILARFGLGENFCRWIKVLYDNPTAEVMTNGIISAPFKLSRSTRQGCPLSPLLFTLAVEMLALAVRSHPTITGITISGVENRISLYADDILMFLSNLTQSLPSLQELIRCFGEFSGYKINSTKSNILFLKESERLNPPVTSFHNSPQGFTYLGIQITPKVKNLIPSNYDPIIASVTQSINRWMSLPLSMIGRINIIKMNILPKFLYLFQSLPLNPPPSFFTRMNKLFTNFIWNEKKSRLRLSLLFLPYERGGLKLPNLYWYYMAAQLRAAMFWFSNTTCASWVQIERSTTSALPLNLYLYSDSIKKLKSKTKNPFVKNTIEIWFKAQKYFGSDTKLSQFSPLWGNQNFTPGRQDRGFKLWADRGVAKISDMYTDEVLLSFELLRNKYNIPPNHFFKYLQIRNFILRTQDNSTQKPPLSVLEKMIVAYSTGRGQVSLIYDMFVRMSTESSEGRRLAWCDDLNSEISVEDWEKACYDAQTQTINTRYKLLQYKWLMRMYISPSKLHHFNPNIPDQCIKCNVEKGTLFHCLWKCPEIMKFWKEVLKILSQIVSEDIPICPQLCILGIFPDNFKINTKKKSLIIYCLLQAKHTIALFWKNPDKPDIKQWYRELSSCLALEKLTFALKGKSSAFQEMWGQFIHFMNANPVGPVVVDSDAL